jgi:hypothetical protein
MRIVAIAGTFDHLHRGHEEFISRAFELGEKVIIGLMSDGYVEGKATGNRQQAKVQLKIQNFKERKEGLVNHLNKKQLLNRAEIVKIDDIYGPTIKDSEIEALVVTRETRKGGRLVNKKRKELGLPPLKLLTVPFAKTQDGRRISSIRIRLGEIDRKGKVFMNATMQQCYNVTKRKRLCLSEEVRQKLKKPQGILIAGDPEDHKKIVSKLKKVIAAIEPIVISTVGDEVTKLCNKIGIKPNLAIFDFKVKRIRIYKNLSDLGFPVTNSSFNFRVINPAGYITRTSVSAIKKSYQGIIKDGKQRLIKIIGEDDLAAVAAILLAPLGTVVLYGQPTEGVVVVEVTEEKKEELMKLLTS